MADLDDFFAKKDRKKSKTNKKFSTTDEVAKKLEDNAKKTEKLKKERNPEGEESNTPAHEQDEWKEFEEEKKDYTGLKIGNLTINSTTEDSDTAESTQEQQPGNEIGQENDKKMGPWKRVDVEVQEETPQKIEPKNATYVPPFRTSQPSQMTMLPTRLRSKTAPDIHNEEFFPTLSKTNDHKKNRTEGGAFEVVQHNKAGTHRHKEQLTKGQGPKLNLKNPYQTLSDS